MARQLEETQDVDDGEELEYVCVVDVVGQLLSNEKHVRHRPHTLATGG